MLPTVEKGGMIYVSKMAKGLFLNLKKDIVTHWPESHVRMCELQQQNIGGAVSVVREDHERILFRGVSSCFQQVFGT